MKLVRFSTIFTNPPPIIPPNSRIPFSLKNLTSIPLFHHNNPISNNPDSSENTKFNCVSEEHCSSVLSICNSRSLKEGVSVHSVVIKLGLHHCLFLNNNLLSLYAKCYGVDPACQLFDEMSERDVVSWTGIISSHVKEGRDEEALALFDHMVGSGIIPNEFTFSIVLRPCASLFAYEQGIRNHAQIIKFGFECNLVLGTALIDFYSKCEKPSKAFDVFVGMNRQDMISWTVMIAGFIQSKDWTRVFELYFEMLVSGVSPNEFTFVNLLKASSFLGADYGKLVHSHIITMGIIPNLVLKTAIVDMYSKCSMMDNAISVLYRSPESDVFLWTAIISGYSQNADFDKVISSFHQMEYAGISPNSFTYAGMLKACSSIPAPDLGIQFHSRIIKAGLELEVSVGNALVDMYMKCSSTVEAASKVFREIISPNIVAWASLITGFAEHGQHREAFRALTNMRVAGFQPNSFTFSGILKACCVAGEVRALHACVIKTRFESDIAVGNSLLDAYSKHGMMDDAWHAMEVMNHRDVITFTTLASGFNQTGDHEKCLKIISHMNADDVKMDGFSMASFLCASASLGAMETGKQLHTLSIKSGQDSWISVGNILVDMYAKCGSITDAQRIFAVIPNRNVVSWNGLIAGLASNGCFSSALSGFEEMCLAGIEPDNITFLVVLYACSHGGLVDLGLDYFDSMHPVYGILPDLDHYVCIVDLLGRAGRLHDAAHLIETMPFTPDALIYKTLLSSCKIHKNLALGEYAAGRALELDPSDPAIYVMLSNMYDDTGKPDYGEQTRRRMRERGLRKNPGQSWIETRNKVHCFMAGDRSHPQTIQIEERLKDLRLEIKKRLGYEEETLGFDSNYYHSERLAVGFGLLNTPSMAAIRVIKNIRICRDCHDFIKHVTQVVDREIVVRDGNRFHSFKRGDCSCGGYW